MIIQENIILGASRVHPQREPVILHQHRRPPGHREVIGSRFTAGESAQRGG